MRFFPKDALIAQPVSVQMPSVSAQIQESVQTEHQRYQPWEGPQFSPVGFHLQLIQNFLVPQHMPPFTLLNSPVPFHLEQEWLRASLAYVPWTVPVIDYPGFCRAFSQHCMGNIDRPIF